jgi:hypothetical protein
MLDERRIFAALAVMLFAYALVGLLAFSARATPGGLFRRLWRRLTSRRGERSK